ncbi:MAG: twin-arginine translocase TatA/TatE family subunit [Kofleriaceae bacterium]
MFGMGGTEILVILIVALLFLGPDKLPEAAKSISKGIRDLRKQTREFQETIEADERFGGAIRDLKSALNGEEPRPTPRPRPAPALPTEEVAAVAAAMTDAERAAHMEGTLPPDFRAEGDDAPAAPPAAPAPPPAAESAPAEGPSVTLPATAGEGTSVQDGAEDLAAMIKPAEGAVAKGSANGHG